MRSTFCPREGETLELIDIGQWPRRADPELLNHVAGCAACSEVVAVATALVEVADSDVRPALPDAGAVWQHAQWQARHEAVHRAARPVVAVQGIVAMGIVAVIVAAIAWLRATGDSGSMFTRVTTAVSEAIGPAIVAVGDIVRIEIPTGALLIAGGAIALGLATVLVAVGVSVLTDLQLERSPRDTPKPLTRRSTGCEGGSA